MSTPIQNLRPGPQDRMLIVGQTGTGKTTLAREILRPYLRVLIIDPKCTYDPKDKRYKMVRGYSQLRYNGHHSHLHYRPLPSRQSVADYDAVYRWAYDNAPLMVYTDETYRTQRGNYSPEWQQAIVTCGRELGIGCVFATQRPRGIDVRIYSEAEHQICFYLKNLDDRKRMSEEMGKIVMIDPIQAALIQTGQEMPYAFWRWDARTRKTRLSQLNLHEEHK